MTISYIDNISVHYYFESAGMILTFISIGKFLESKSKNKTSAAIKNLRIKRQPNQQKKQQGHHKNSNFCCN
jgi:cation transport ATPase